MVAAVVVLDLFLPALVVLLLAAVSLRLHHEGPASLGLRRPAHWGRLEVHAVVLAAVWSLVAVALTKPTVEHLTGERQDVSGFAEVEGDLGLLLTLLVLSWTLAASSVFGLLHTEQGVVGVTVSTVDAVYGWW